MAEAIALVVWKPETGDILTDVLAADSPIRLDTFHIAVEAAYISRYKGLPPHAS